MNNAILERMMGEELPMFRILGGARASIEAELDRRALLSTSRRRNIRRFWAGRTFAIRHSARLAA